MNKNKNLSSDKKNNIGAGLATFGLVSAGELPRIVKIENTKSGTIVTVREKTTYDNGSHTFEFDHDLSFTFFDEKKSKNK